jgi:hypothetical protein
MDALVPDRRGLAAQEGVARRERWRAIENMVVQMQQGIRLDGLNKQGVLESQPEGSCSCDPVAGRR